jgi:hypothetical protein
MAHAIRPAVESDAALIVELIRGLADYEKMLDQLETTEDAVRSTLFPPGGRPPDAFCVIGDVDGAPAGFAL